MHDAALELCSTADVWLCPQSIADARTSSLHALHAENAVYLSIGDQIATVRGRLPEKRKRLGKNWGMSALRRIPSTPTHLP